jgi:hypothetical protein
MSRYIKKYNNNFQWGGDSCDIIKARKTLLSRGLSCSCSGAINWEDVETTASGCCQNIANILKSMESINHGNINMIDSINRIFAYRNQNEINQFLDSYNVELINDDELDYNDDNIFFKIYAFVKFYYNVLKSNDYDKQFKYFYITDRLHYKVVLESTIHYRKKLAGNLNYSVPRYLKIAAIFHDIERYSKQLQYQALDADLDPIRKQILHPINSVMIMNIMFHSITNLEAYNIIKDIIAATELILRHDIPLKSNTEQKEVKCPESEEVIDPGMNYTNSLFLDLKALITADSIELFKHSYPFFIIYVKNKSGNTEATVLERLNTSLKKVPKEYVKDIKNYIMLSIHKYTVSTESVVNMDNMKLISKITEQFFNDIDAYLSS